MIFVLIFTYQIFVLSNSTQTYILFICSVSLSLCPSLSLLHPFSLSVHFTHIVKLPKVNMVVWVPQGWNDWQWCSWRTAELAASNIILHTNPMAAVVGSSGPSFAPLGPSGSTKYSVYDESYDVTLAIMLQRETYWKIIWIVIWKLADREIVALLHIKGEKIHTDTVWATANIRFIHPSLYGYRIYYAIF